jgi:putative SOS response-associated peptidase YedK
MCGRFVITSSPEAIRKLFGYPDQPNLPARYNIAPTQPVPVVLAERGARKFMLMRWGFLPAWTKDPKKFGLVINARAESVIEKPSFRNAIRRRRCLVPADGYYEWHHLGSRKQPLFVHPAKGGPIAFAALWETWVGPNGEEVDTVAIVTTAASRDLAAFHPRMPVTIAPGAFELWLDCANVEATVATSLLIAPPVGTFAWHEVSAAVNRVANDDERLIAPVTAEQLANEAADAEAAKQRAKPPRKTGSSDQGSLF